MAHYDKGMSTYKHSYLKTSEAEPLSHLCAALRRDGCTHTLYRIYFHLTAFKMSNYLGDKRYHTFDFKRCSVEENHDCTSCLCMFPTQLEERKQKIELGIYSKHMGRGEGGGVVAEA